MLPYVMPLICTARVPLGPYSNNAAFQRSSAAELFGAIEEQLAETACPDYEDASQKWGRTAAAVGQEG